MGRGGRYGFRRRRTARDGATNHPVGDVAAHALVDDLHDQD
ncbi:hypothetical protein FHR84_003004 [Actinopolyspora biskrensis]|uniref:Uncharacterized protein n=1 Tax=Actinopolyspora biskrensis TaxID=1470178 RepID=A0A852Z7Z7_9ACTN|nr:hypothetical protein [Actinopolyspora biskrensis]NYH79666.1 hypothetical protein [Actinopolyspora biskrensis]